MRLPTLKASAVERQFTDCFYGYRRAARLNPGEFYHTENLSTEAFPLLSQRRKRGFVKKLSAPGALLGGERLCYIDDGTLYIDGEATGLTGISPGEKQLVGMGAYICVFPDKLYYNCAEPTDFGSMEASYSSAGRVEYALCTLDGGELPMPETSDSAPESPENGALWMDNTVLRQWSEALSCWVELTGVYVKLSFISEGEIPGLFNKLDGVRISGAAVEDLNGSKILYGLGTDKAGRDYILLQGLITESISQSEGSVTIERRLPQMDYVCQCRNRLWGCRWGGGLNEIYCCALGDFKNWEQFLGLSTDSWRASVGVEGEWTGAVCFMDSPCFFKASGIGRVSVSELGAHRLSFIGCSGMEQGSHRSAAQCDGALIYKAPGAVCIWQGGYPEEISQALGDVSYKNAVSAALGKLIYISMEDEAGQRQLFVYDMRRKLWIREDSLPISQLAAVGQELYALAHNELWALRGSVGESESFIPWQAQSGVMGYRQPGKKYISRFILRLEMEQGAEMRVYVRYDSGEDWLLQGEISRRGRGSVLIPVRPRRCDHMELKLEGRGEVRLLSLCRVLERGGDI